MQWVADHADDPVIDPSYSSGYDDQHLLPVRPVITPEQLYEQMQREEFQVSLICDFL